MHPPPLGVCEHETSATASGYSDSDGMSMTEVFALLMSTYGGWKFGP